MLAASHRLAAGRGEGLRMLNYELWFHPLSGIVLLLFVIAAGRDLAESSSRRLRWSMGLMLVSFLALQTLSILRSVFDTRDFAHLPYTFFGMSDLVAALALFSWFVTRRPRGAGGRPAG